MLKPLHTSSQIFSSSFHVFFALFHYYVQASSEDAYKWITCEVCPYENIPFAVCDLLLTDDRGIISELKYFLTE